MNNLLDNWNFMCYNPCIGIWWSKDVFPKSARIPVGRRNAMDNNQMIEDNLTGGNSGRTVFKCMEL